MNFSTNSIFKGDRGIWIIILFLFIYSVISVYSASSQLAFNYADGNSTKYLLRQVALLLLGVSVTVIVHNIPFRYFSKISVFLWYASLVLLVVTLFWGLDVNDAKRWISLPGGLTLQTSDMAKIFLLMYLARTLSLKEAEINSIQGSLKLIFLPIVITCGLIFPADLSTAALLFGVSMILVFLSKLKFKYIALMLGITAIFAVIMVGVIKTNSHIGRFQTWNNRIEGFTDPSKPENIQETRSKAAVASGGLFGKGPGQSTQRNSLPHPYSDYIFAVIVEEFGLLFGALPLIALYLFLFLRAKKIIKKVNRKFGAYIVSAMTILIVVQALSNMAVTANLFPVTGQPLPFVSYGGTSIFFVGLAFGIILSVSRDIMEKENAESIESNVNIEPTNTEIDG